MQVFCAECGGTLERSSWAVNRFKKFFCNKACQGIHRKVYANTLEKWRAAMRKKAKRYKEDEAYRFHVYQRKKRNYLEYINKPGNREKENLRRKLARAKQLKDPEWLKKRAKQMMKAYKKYMANPENRTQEYLRISLSRKKT